MLSDLTRDQNPVPGLDHDALAVGARSDVERIRKAAMRIQRRTKAASERAARANESTPK